MQARRREGLRSFPLRLCQNKLAHGEIGPQPLVFLLQLFQTGKLRPLHPAIRFPPPIERLLRYTDLAHRLCNRRALPLHNFNLPKLRYDLFGLLTFSSHR